MFVRLLFINFNIVLAIVGNKSDDYENEKVKDVDAKNLAKTLNAVFQRTSAKQGSGIDELFRIIGKHFLNPDVAITSNLTKEEMIKHNQQIKIKEIKDMNNKEKKKNCC